MCNDLYVAYLQAVYLQATCNIVATRVINFQIDIHKARLWPLCPATSQRSVARQEQRDMRLRLAERDLTHIMLTLLQFQVAKDSAQSK